MSFLRRLKEFLLAIAVFAVVAAAQLTLFVAERPAGPWFLFGTDTVSHDALVHLWVQAELAAFPGTIPLWLDRLHGGLPTLGAFLYTPFAPPLAGLPVLSFPAAQWTSWWFSLLWAGLGAWCAARVLRLPMAAALVSGVAWMLAGHLVTLIHAGHLQKVMALAWLGWAAAGAIDCASPHRWPRGVGLCGASIGMMFLSGHPQIAYLAAAMTVALAAAGALPKRTVWPLVRVGAAVVLGGVFGAAQLLPGLDMARWSNRAAGVSFAEATATSHPPFELLELVFPRVLGSNTPADGGRYLGAWGERIVSDYAGVVVLALAILAGADRHRRVWCIAIGLVAVGGVLVGAGHHTPIYAVLFHTLPGFASFRSPGTFMAANAFAFALLAGIGTAACLRRRRPSLPVLAACFGVVALAVVGGGLARLYAGPADDAQARMGAVLAASGALLAGAAALVALRARLGATAAGMLLVGLIAGDLATANRAFLRAVPWNDYAGFLAAHPTEDAFRTLAPPRRVHYAGNPLSLRPMLLGIDVLEGYHPITWALKESHRAARGEDLRAWLADWGVATVVVPDGRGGQRVAEHIGGAVFTFDPPGEARIAWSRVAARETVTVNATRAGTITARQVRVPGWVGRIESPGADPVELLPEEPMLRWTAKVPAGTSRIIWSYEPPAYRTGLHLTGVGIAAAVCLLLLPRRRRVPRATKLPA